MSVDMKITVDELIAAPFASRSQTDKERIISDGRPKPHLEMTVAITDNEMNTTNYEGSSYDTLVWRCRDVNNSAQLVYDEIEWLTASVTNRSFYCWPCLLFQPPGAWNKTGVSDVIVLRGGAPEHEKTSEHIEAMFHLQTFIHQYLKTKNGQTVVESPGALKRLTDVVCSLVAAQQPPNEPDKVLSLLEVNNCIRTMMLLRKYDSLNKSDSDHAIALMRKSPEVVVRMVNAVAKVVKSSIAKEIGSCKYVSLIISQHSNVKSKAQISSILRYVKDGTVNERFLGFTHVFSSASVDSIYTHIKSLVNEFDIGTKCIAVSLDGAILPNDEINVLCRMLKINIAQHCTFVPWHGHSIAYVLQKCASTDPKCGHFFKTMAALEAYFCENSELCTAFNDFMPENKLQDIPVKSQCAGNWFVTTEFLTYVHENRQHFVLFFDFVIANHSKWDGGDVAKAFGFREYLKDLMAAFLLALFSKFFQLASHLSAALSSDVPERSCGKGMVAELVNNLKLVRIKDFDYLIFDAVEKFGLEGYGYVTLFNGIVRRVAEEVEARYGILDKFQFCGLFDFEEEGCFERTTHHLQNLSEVYDIDFGKQKTESEMELLRTHGAFSKRSVYDFHQYLRESNLKHTFKALFDISELILVLPFRQASPTREMSVLNKIGRWSFGPERLPTWNDTSIVFVESDYLQQVKQSPTFYDKVFANFSQ